MKELISALEDLELSLGNMQEHLRGEEWPSREARLAANDVIISLDMAAHAVASLLLPLAPLEEAKAEVKEIIEEEKGGEDLGEQVPEPEDREAGDQVSIQEPEAEGSEGDQHLRNLEG
jgi:hypothetical protein